MSINLFLIEIFVENLSLWTNPVIDEDAQVEFTFLNNISIEVKANEFRKTRGHFGNTCMFTLPAEETEFEQYKSMFIKVFKQSESVEKVCVGIGNVDLMPLFKSIELALVPPDQRSIKTASNTTTSSNRSAQKKSTSRENDGAAVVPQQAAEKPKEKENPLPVSEKYKAMYPLLSEDGLTNVGAICVLLRLTCFGPTIGVNPIKCRPSKCYV